MRILCLVLLCGCGGSPGNSDGAVDGGADLAPGNPFAIACGDTLAAVYDRPAGLPAYDDSRRGDVVRCAFDKAVTAAQIDAWLAQVGYTGVAAQSGVRVYRVAYRTDRLRGKEGITSALVYVPDKPAGTLVVYAHGTVGAPAKCVPSQFAVLDSTQQDHGIDLALAGHGFTVVAPDYAGYGYGSIPGWLLSEDEAHSLLDGSRAARKLLPTGLGDKVYMVGHSQGGHAVLSAQALAGAYGLGGSLGGVVAMAPPWWVGKTWGVILSPAAGLDTTKYAGPIAYAVLYYYTHGEVYDGAGGGLAMFQPGKRAQVDAMMTTMCGGEAQAAIATLGKTPSDFFDPAFADSVGTCGLLDDCAKEPAATWLKRFRADRPPTDVKGAPIVIWQGGKDGTVPPDRAQCGFDKVTDDLKTAGSTATLTLCGDADADHGSVVRLHMGWVNSWIDARAHGDKDPTCSAPAPLTCAMPPTNVD